MRYLTSHQHIYMEFLMCVGLRWTRYLMWGLLGKNSGLTRAWAMYRSSRQCLLMGADRMCLSQIQMTALPHTQFLNRRQAASPSLPSGSPAASDRRSLSTETTLETNEEQNGKLSRGEQEFTCSFSLEFSSISSILCSTTQLTLSEGRKRDLAERNVKDFSCIFYQVERCWNFSEVFHTVD